MRAVKHGQTTSISKYMLVANEKKSIVAAATHFTESVTEVFGAMSDGSKRRRDVEESEDTLSCCQEWEQITDTVYSPKTFENMAIAGPVSYSGGGGHHGTPMPGKNQPSGVDQGEDITIPIPEDNINSADWGLTYCRLDKMKSRNIRYSEMVLLAKSDVEMHDYLKFIQEHFGKNAKNKVTKKYTKAVDLASYLDRIRWSPNSTGVQVASFKREK